MTQRFAVSFAALWRYACARIRSIPVVRSFFAVPAITTAALVLAMSSVSAAPSTIDEPAPALGLVAAERIGNAFPTQELPPPPQPQEVRYRVSFVSTWTSASHPTTLPPNAHFSPVVVATHTSPDALFQRGAPASTGIESMAETGATGTLNFEMALNPAITSSQVGSSIFGAGTNTFEVTLAQDASLVSLVSMIAPSPDWFVGTRNADLFVDGVWVDRLDLPFANYDAGTDSGTNFTSSNFDTDPAQVIDGPRDAAFSAAVAEGSLGNITIERL